MEIIKLGKDNWQEVLFKTKKVLENNGLVVFPSDTVYGLAVNAKSEKAVSKLLQFKDRPRGKAISVAVASLENFFSLTTSRKKIQKTPETILPGPFTVVVPSNQKVDKRLEAEDKTLGIRFPKNKFMNELNTLLDFPYTATSANLNGKGPHYSITAFLNTLSEKKKTQIDLIVDGGELPKNLPSTVLRLDTDTLEILRPGTLNPKLIYRQITNSESETKKLAQNLLITNLALAKYSALIFILQGELGTGKTIFTKGLGEYLQTEPIISPTFVIFYEYITKNPLIQKLYHFDLYRLETQTDLNNLAIKQYNHTGNLLIFEWGEKIGSIDQFFSDTQKNIFLINIQALSENQREFKIYQIDK